MRFDLTHRGPPHVLWGTTRHDTTRQWQRIPSSETAASNQSCKRILTASPKPRTTSRIFSPIGADKIKTRPSTRPPSSNKTNQNDRWSRETCARRYCRVGLCLPPPLFFSSHPSSGAQPEVSAPPLLIFFSCSELCEENDTGGDSGGDAGGVHGTGGAGARTPAPRRALPQADALPHAP